MLYAATGSRYVAFWDTGEMQTVPWIAGIAHPTGFPVFVALGWAFAHAVAFGPVAWRLACFSGVATAVAALALYGVALDLTRRPAVACAGALLFVTTHVVWVRATRAEVHSLALAFTVAALWCAQRYVAGGRRAYLSGTAALAGLALATHPVAVWSCPGLALLVLAGRRPPPSLAVRTAALGAACALVPYATLPLWSALVAARHPDPTAAIGLPAGMPFWDYAHVAAPASFWWFVTGRQFEKTDGLHAYLEPGRYFAFASDLASLERTEWTVAGVALAVVGMVALARRSPLRATSFALACFAAVPFAFAYTLEADKARYLLVALWASALFVTLGVGAIADVLFARFGPRVAGGIAAAGLASWALASAFAHDDALAIARDTTARDYVRAVVAASPPNAILVAPWSFATPLAYAAYVERSLAQRVVVASDPAAMTGRIVVWTRTRCVVVVGDTPEMRVAGTAVRSIGRHSGPYVFTVSAAGAHPCDSGVQRMVRR